MAGWHFWVTIRQGEIVSIHITHPGTGVEAVVPQERVAYAWELMGRYKAWWWEQDKLRCLWCMARGFWPWPEKAVANG